jgi:hypothetical protein
MIQISLLSNIEDSTAEGHARPDAVRLASDGTKQINRDEYAVPTHTRSGPGFTLDPTWAVPPSNTAHIDLSNLNLD